MSWSFFIPIAASALAFYTALFHGWIFLLRHEERTHLWFAVTALGIFGSSLVQAAERRQRGYGGCDDVFLATSV